MLAPAAAGLGLRGKGMTDELDTSSILRVYVVFNGPLGMSAGKMASQAFQACERLFNEMHGEGHEDDVERVHAWRKYTTTIVRVAKTPAMFARVCDEVPGVTMVDEGFTEVDPDTPTCHASWPVLESEAPAILRNAKVPLMRMDAEREPHTVREGVHCSCGKEFGTVSEANAHAAQATAA